MPIEVAIIVTDSPPLITLAVAQSLDYLLYPDLPVIIPDALFHEATSAAGKLGAQEILDWYRAHTDRVRVEPIEFFTCCGMAAIGISPSGSACHPIAHSSTLCVSSLQGAMSGDHEPDSEEG